MPYQTKLTASTTTATWERMEATKATKVKESFMINTKRRWTWKKSEKTVCV
jgi:hypothetical protein